MRQFTIQEETKKRLGHYKEAYIANILRAFETLESLEGDYNYFDICVKVAELTYSVVSADDDGQPVFQYVGC